ncbi:MAG: O-methyltransferase [Bacteroidales bacterium]|jgi:predicted O-methyltransferase YrrM|nr:O-methyltransferase [Bacteroidales bacterium]
MKEALQEYIYHHLGPESELLSELYRQTHLRVLYPEMVSGHEQGRLLSMISHMVRPERILEIGTFTGYSAICLAEGLPPQGRLYTIDKNDELKEMSDTFFRKAGLQEKIVSYIGDALEIIPRIDDLFDLVFIDAAKKEYLEYYHAVFDKVKQGGYILVDNILWYNKIYDHQIQDATTEKLRIFNDFVRKDERVEKAIIENRDGLFILRKK